MEVTPELVSITIGVVNVNVTANDALNGNTFIVNQISSAIQNLSIPAANISTAYFSIQPNYVQVSSNMTQ